MAIKRTHPHFSQEAEADFHQEMTHTVIRKVFHSWHMQIVGIYFKLSFSSKTFVRVILMAAIGLS